MASKRAGMQEWKKADGGLLHGTGGLYQSDSDASDANNASDAVMRIMQSDVTSSAETPRKMNRTNRTKESGSVQQSKRG